MCICLHKSAPAHLHLVTCLLGPLWFYHWSTGNSSILYIKLNVSFIPNAGLKLKSKMSYMIKSFEDSQTWRPMTLGIGSSLAISKRQKCFTAPPTTGTKFKPLVYPKSATTTPRHSKHNAGEEKPRSKSVSASRMGDSWRLASRNATQEVTDIQTMWLNYTSIVAVSDSIAASLSTNQLTVSFNYF